MQCHVSKSFFLIAPQRKNNEKQSPGIYLG
jgi:hypothetical protein